MKGLDLCFLYLLKKKKTVEASFLAGLSENNVEQF
jgi:hypothetical protein